MNKVVKAYIPVLLGGIFVIHWWWSSLHPFIESSIFEFFVSHLLLGIGAWFLLPRTQHGQRLALFLGALFIIYGFFMATLLIPGGFEEIGIFAIAIPMYLAALGVMLGAGSILSVRARKIEN